MIEVDAELRGIIDRGYVLDVRVESWLGGTLLSDDVPVAGGHEEFDRALNVPELVRLTVPKRDRGQRWTPTTPDHPLAANGQRLRVMLGVGSGHGETVWIQRGWFLVQSAGPIESGAIEVNASGLLAMPEEARLVSPFQPTGTFVSTLRALVEPAVTVDVTAAPVDRSVPAGLNWDEDRMGAVLELLDAWAADAAVDPDGVLVVVPDAVPGAPVRTFTDGIGGTVIEVAGSSTREGAANAWVARGTAPDGGLVQSVAYDTVTPKAVGGPFNPLPVPEFFYSPLLETVTQCAAAAATIARRRMRGQALELTVEAVPDPTIQAGDVVTLISEDYPAGLLCSVEAGHLPYVADGGPMRLTVRSVVT